MEATHLYKWYILRTVLSYWNITKRSLMYLHEKSEILYNPNADELLNKPFELIAKCHHGNKYLPCNYRSKTKKTSQRIVASNPETYLKIGFLENYAKFMKKLPHCVECKLFRPVPWSYIFRESNFCRFLGNASENPWWHPFAESFLTRGLCEGAYLLQKDMELYICRATLLE